MKKHLLLIFTLLFLWTLFSYGEIIEKKLSVSENVFVHIKTISGDVKITGWSKSGEVLVKAETKGNNISPLIVKKGNQISIGESREKPGFFGKSCGSVDFNIFVPYQTTVRGKSISGEIEVIDLKGNLELKTVSGNIDINVKQSMDIEVESVSGSIRCRVNGMFSSILDANNISGEIDIVLPQGANARLGTSSLSGTITCELDLSDKEKKKGFGSTTLKGIMGNGTGRIKINTISGDISILR